MVSRLDEIEKLLAAEPNDVFLNFSLGMEYAGAGRTDDAVRQFDRVIELDPEYIAAYSRQADALIAMGHKDQARQALTAGIGAAQRKGDQHAADQMNKTLNTLG